MEVLSRHSWYLLFLMPLYQSVFHRSMMGSGREPDLVHLEAKTVDGRKYLSFQIL